MHVLDAALNYHARGFCVIPIRAGTKVANSKWMQYQTGRPDLGDVQKWFANGNRSLAIIAGDVSGGLVVRDFDAMPSYGRWAGLHPDLAGTLPTVATVRGRHVYCRADICQIRAASKSAGSIIDLGDGELRGGGYTLAPPSNHPNGPAYRWLVRLPAGQLPFIDLREAGLLGATESSREHGEQQRTLRNTEAIGEEGEVSIKSVIATHKLPWTKQIKLAILQSLPTGPGKRNWQVFELARALKAIPELSDADAKELKPYVVYWHAQAQPVITTQPFEETWVDFLRAWPRVKFPKGTEPMKDVFAAAVATEPPDAALQYEQAPFRLLVSLCRELQRRAKDGPFYLSCRTAGRLLGVNHTTAWRWLFLLEQDDVLGMVCRGSKATMKATRYIYLAGL